MKPQKSRLRCRRPSRAAAVIGRCSISGYKTRILVEGIPDIFREAFPGRKAHKFLSNEAQEVSSKEARVRVVRSFVFVLCLLFSASVALQARPAAKEVWGGVEYATRPVTFGGVRLEDR